MIGVSKYCKQPFVCTELGGQGNPIKLDYSVAYLASESNRVRSFLCSHCTETFIIFC